MGEKKAKNDRRVELLEFSLYDVSPREELDEASGQKRMVLEGVVQQADVVNQNNRIYPKPVMQKAVAELASKVESRKVFGELDHPEFRGSLRDTSHLVTKLYWDEQDDSLLRAEMVVLNTPQGQTLREIVRAGGRPGFSSRGKGETEPQKLKNGQQVEVVKPGFRFSTFDVVSDQSVQAAEISKVTEHLNLPLFSRQEITEEVWYAQIAEAVEKEDNGGPYDCECIKCGHRVTSDEHCRDIKCSKCGGEMRRVERPGPGKESRDTKSETNGEKEDTMNGKMKEAARRTEQEPEEPPKKKKKPGDPGYDPDVDGVPEAEEPEEPPKKKKKPGDPGYDPDVDGVPEAEEPEEPPKKKKKPGDPGYDPDVDGVPEMTAEELQRELEKLRTAKTTLELEVATKSESLGRHMEAMTRVSQGLLALTSELQTMGFLKATEERKKLESTQLESKLATLEAKSQELQEKLDETRAALLREKVESHISRVLEKEPFSAVLRKRLEGCTTTAEVDKKLTEERKYVRTILEENPALTAGKGQVEETKSSEIKAQAKRLAGITSKKS